MMHNMVVAEYFAFPGAPTIGNDVAWFSRPRTEENEIRASFAVGQYLAERPSRRFICPRWMLWLTCIIHWRNRPERPPTFLSEAVARALAAHHRNISRAASS